MTDIVERLRKRQMMQTQRSHGDRTTHVVAVSDALCQQAADEIERLRAALRLSLVALELVNVHGWILADYEDGITNAMDAARDALASGKHLPTTAPNSVPL